MRTLTPLALFVALTAHAQIPIDPDYQLLLGDRDAGRVFTPPGQDRCAYEELWYLFPGTPDVTAGVGDPFVGDPFHVLPAPQTHRTEADFLRDMAARHPGGTLVRVFNHERGGVCP